MTIKNVIKTLQKAGYNVSFYKRKDGGIRITRINGQTFRGSSGNVEARKITGTKLSELQERALSKLVTPKGKGNYDKRRTLKLDEETRKMIRNLQYRYRKEGKKEGKPTQRNYRYVMRTEGKEEADRLLRQSYRRIVGLAYTENVDALIERLEKNKNKLRSTSRVALIQDIINRLTDMRETLRESTLGKIVDVDGPLYHWEQRVITTEEFARQVNELLDKN